MPDPKTSETAATGSSHRAETRWRTAVLALATAGLTCLLFLGGLGESAPRSLHHLWDLGHVALFYCATLLALRIWPGLSELPSGRRWGSILAAAGALGALSEVLQSGFGRTPDLGDLWRDLLGSAAALALSSPRSAGRSSRAPSPWPLACSAYPWLAP
ncbi:MAG: hypothetical protein IH608_09815 [Proteobacteria bacterium]|nr:hypothetical protein [Pseudomonadota bacterium]